MWVIRSWFGWIACKKRVHRSKNSLFMFLTVFPLFMSKSKSFPSLFAHLLLFKERFEQFAPMAIYKRVTNDHERFAQVAHDKRATGEKCSFSPVNCSFTHKKWANCSKNQWANSQPWFSKVSAQTKYSTVVIAINTSEWCWTVENPPVVKLCCWNMWSKLKGLACMCQLHNIGKKVL